LAGGAAQRERLFARPRHFELPARVQSVMRSLLRLDSLDRYGGFAPLAIRLFLGVFLVFMSQDNVFSAARMDEFAKFLAANHFPEPDIAARVSVYAQFACGILVFVGLITRWAAWVMSINFIVALIGVHRGLPFRTWLEPCSMLACSIALFIGGAGRMSLDWRLARRHRT
jgi:putative oxidoreductase